MLMPSRNDLLLPNSKEAERSVLGSCLVSSDALGTAAEILKPEDFYDPAHIDLFRVITSLNESGKPVDFLTVSEELKARSLFESLGGDMFIAEIMSSVTTTANIITHSEIVKEYALRRRMIKAGEKIASIARKLEFNGSEIISESEAEILKASQNMSQSSPVSSRELSGSVMKEIENIYRNGANQITGYSSGFADLDGILLGFQPGTLNIIAARPSMGKTALALNIAQFGGVEGTNPTVLMFSLEMSARQLMQRMYAAESGVDLTSITGGTMSEEEFSRLTKASKSLGEKNIYINDSSELSAVDFRTKCRRFKTHHPELSLIVVDYLQLMHMGRGKADNRQQETADISRMLKAVAIELECPVIALSQLSREVERRTEKKPQLSDLRDSGAIEQDTDTVILLYRGDYYDESRRNSAEDGKAELRIAKNRNGRTGMCNLTFRRGITRFTGYYGI